MARVVTPVLMGDPAARKVRAPTEAERAWAERPQPHLPTAAPPPKSRPSRAVPKDPNVRAICAALKISPAAARAAFLLLERGGLELGQVAELCGVKRSCAKQYVSHVNTALWATIGTGVYLKDRSYRLSAEARSFLLDILSADEGRRASPESEAA